MKKDFTPKSRKENLVVQELDGEVLIYDLQTDKAFCLNITSALVWQACDGNKNVSEISEWVGEKLNAANNEDLVWLALDQLKKEKLIENDAEIANRFEGMSRRQVIKKIGLSSLVALPVVASLVAPVAAQTTSVCNGTCRCPNPTPNTGDCMGGGGGFTPVYMDCNALGAGNNCDCEGPFGSPGSAGAGLKTGMCTF